MWYFSYGDSLCTFSLVRVFYIVQLSGMSHCAQMQFVHLSIYFCREIVLKHTAACCGDRRVIFVDIYSGLLHLASVYIAFCFHCDHYYTCSVYIPFFTVYVHFS